MRGIVSLCEVTHHGLHEWSWKSGGGRTGVVECVCSSEKLGGRTCGRANRRAEGLLHVCVLGGRRDADFMHH